MSHLLLRSIVVLSLVLGAAGPAAAQQRFRIDTLARAPFAQYPSGIAMAPDGSGRFFFTEKNNGRVRLFDRVLHPEPFATVPVDNEGEQGLLSVAVHPGYPDTPFVFLFYVRATDRLGIVERFTDSAGTGIHAEQILIIPRMTDAMEHNGGALAFGPDGRLYVGVGDHRTQRAHVQDTTNRRAIWGKILRINPDGSIPPDNPIPGRPFWAWGLRDPRALAFDAATGALYVADGGTEGVNMVFRVHKGDNLGWPFADRTRHPATTRPLVHFSSPPQPALTGLLVYRGSAFPRLRGALLFCGNAIPAVWSASSPPGTDSLHIERFFEYPSGFADLKEGPDGCLYLANGPYLSSKIIRLSPLPPVFLSTPPAEAVQDEPYAYHPAFGGTPPEVRLLHGPAGMTVDSATGSVRWIPTNDQAVRGHATFVLEARNGAATAEQVHTIRVINVNDPPRPFTLSTPPDLEVVNFSGGDPDITLHWERATDPDGDTLQYIIEVDTSTAFNSPAYHLFMTRDTDSLHVRVRRAGPLYYWRVSANDGHRAVAATPRFGRIVVTYAVTTVERPQRPIPAPAPVIPEPPLAPPPDPSSGIIYTVRYAGTVRLSVFNLLGQEIVRVHDGYQEEGTYEVAYSSLGLPSGVYIYRLQAPGVFETKKMVIARR